MRLHNATPLVVGAFHGPRPKGLGLTFVVKGTFSLLRGDRAIPVASTERTLLDGERPWDDAKGASPRYPGDFAPFKPHADVTMVGTLRARETSRTSAEVRLRVGPIDRTLIAVGERRWRRSTLGRLEATSPAPLGNLPLRYEVAFGGAGFGANPVGLGAAYASSPEAEGDGARLPQLEDPKHLLGAPEDLVPPAGFGPLAACWSARSARLGTYDDAWRRTRWPYFPEDFDWAYFNAAPSEQQVVGYLRGDEALLVEGLTGTGSRLEATLPGLRPRLFVLRKGEPISALAEVVLALDTLWVDADAERLVLVWRGGVETAERRGRDVERALVVVEPLDRAAPSPATYALPLLWDDDEPALDEELVPTVPREPRAPKQAPREENVAPPESEDDDETWSMLSGMLRSQGLSEDEIASAVSEVRATTLAAMASANDVTAALDAASAPLEVAPLAIDPEVEAQAFALLAELGVDPKTLVVNEEADSEEPSPEAARTDLRDRAALEAHVAAGGMLDGLDLTGIDLSGMDLSRVSLVRANLTAANLEGTRLRDADLTGAILSRARASTCDFSGALLSRGVLDGCDLSSADLSHANLARADLTGATLTSALLLEADLQAAQLVAASLERACLDGANLAEATLSDARLVEARARRASFRRACLDRVDARRADFSGAVLGSASLARASFEEAVLREASLEGAHGEAASFARADVQRLRAGHGAELPRASFRGATGERATFTSSSLLSADFSDSALRRATFREAILDGANFHRARLEESDLTRASLRSARLTKVNLFQVRMPEADLSDADCSKSHFFGAELHEVTTVGTRFEGAELGRTKLEGDARA